MRLFRWDFKPESMPVEFYVFLLPSLLISLLLLSVHAQFVRLLIEHFTKLPLKDAVMGDTFLFVLVIAVLVYLSSRMLVRLFSRKNRSIKPAAIGQGGRERVTNIISSGIFLFLLIAFTSLVLFLLVLQIFYSADLAKIVQATIHALALDKSLFGTYLTFSAGAAAPYIGNIATWSYISMSWMIPLAVAVLFFMNKKLFRSFVMAFFLIFMISLPIWYLFPAISPSAMYRFNIFSVPIPKTIQDSMDSHPLAPALKDDIASVEEQYIDKSYQTVAVSTFPSMHAAWATIVAYYGTALFWPLGIVLIPWALFNMFGAVYLEQHYGVDIIAGVAVAFLAIFIVNYLLRVEKKYFREKYHLFLIVEMANADVRRAAMWIAAKFRRRRDCANIQA